MTKLNRPFATAVIVSIIPVLLWLGMFPFAARWQDMTAALQSLSQLTGIIGLALFSITIALSARFHWLERLMGPLDNIYAAHHTLGITAFACLLCHPIFAILFAYESRLPNITHFIIPGLDNALTWGILSLWTLALLMVLTIYLRPRYPLWRKTHQFLGLSLFLAGLHGLFISSDISTSPFLRAYLLGLCFAALILFTSYTLLNRATVRRYSYRVQSVDRLSDAVATITLSPTGVSLPAAAGQFVFIRFWIDGRWSETHPFSLTVVDKDRLALSIKAIGDDTENLIETVEPGMSAQTEGPFGAFGREMRTAPRSICVAGGIGVTPFLSLLAGLMPECSADVYYAVRNEKEAVHLPALKTLAAATMGRVRIFPWFSENQGLLTAEILIERSAVTKEDQFFLCGPPKMMHALHKGLVKNGVEKGRIHFEEFSFD